MQVHEAFPDFKQFYSGSFPPGTQLQGIHRSILLSYGTTMPL